MAGFTPGWCPECLGNGAAGHTAAGAGDPMHADAMRFDQRFSPIDPRIISITC